MKGYNKNEEANVYQSLNLFIIRFTNLFFGSPDQGMSRSRCSERVRPFAVRASANDVRVRERRSFAVNELVRVRVRSFAKSRQKNREKNRKMLKIA